MITFFLGTPGSGKTYDAVQKIIANLRSGRVVCTNIDGMDDQRNQQYIKDQLNIEDDVFKHLFRFLTKSQVMKFWLTQKAIKHAGTQFESTTDELICPKGSLIVIDEAHKFFNSQDWQKSENRQLADWASTHRHDGYDLILITQEIGKVEKNVRTLAEWSYVYRKVNFLGTLVKQKYMVYSYTGDDTNGRAIATNYRHYRPEIFKCYKSYTHADAKEVGFMQHTNILKHPVFYAIPVIVLCFLYMFFAKSSFAKGDLFGSSAVAHKYVAPKVVAKSAPAASNIPAPAPVSVVPVSVPGVTAPGVSVPGSIETLPGVQRQPFVPVSVQPVVPVVVGSVSVDPKKYFLLLSDGRTVVSKLNRGIGTQYLN